MNTKFIVGLLALLACSTAQADVVLLREAVPQSYSNSCQSYSVAYSLGTVPDSPFAVKSAVDLRALEQDLKAKIVSVAKGMNVDPSNHQAWARAVREYTSGTFELREVFPQDEEGVFTKVEELTGRRNADALPLEFTPVLTKTPALVSFQRIGANSYASGHIVAVLGTVGQAGQRRQLLLLNQAVKGPDGKKISCSATDPSLSPGDKKYRAVTSIEKDFQLKNFSGKYSVLWLERK